jgi:AbrB family looped-hinge helix DNA binding protein
MRVADAVWVATALLHQENPAKEDFEVKEIVSRTVKENLVGGFRSGLQPHVSWHCVANKKPNGGRYRMLYETARGHRRLLRNGDTSHPDRNGDIRPDKAELPVACRPLVDWYDTVYSKQTSPSASAPLGTNAEPTLTQEGGSARLPEAPISEIESGSGTAFVSSAGAFVIPGQLRKELGIHEGTRLSIHRERDHLVLQPVTDELIRSLRGRYKGTSLVEDREREHRVEKDRLTR